MTAGYASGGRREAMPSTRSASDQIMHGCAAEQQIIHDLLRRAHRGHGGVVLVDGEPGTGKSLLLRETIGAAAGRGFSLAALPETSPPPSPSCFRRRPAG